MGDHRGIFFWFIAAMAPMQALATSLLLTGVSAASLCMDVPAVGMGVQTQVWGCNGLGQQQWSVTGTSGTNIISLLEGQYRCLNLPGKDTSNGNIVEVGPCEVPISSWFFDADSWQIQFQVEPTKCLDAGDMSEGSQIMIWDCNGMSQQKWGYDSWANTIYLADSRRLQFARENSSMPQVLTNQEGVSVVVSNSTRKGSGDEPSRHHLRGSSAPSLP